MKATMKKATKRKYTKRVKPLPLDEVPQRSLFEKSAEESINEQYFKLFRNNDAGISTEMKVAIIQAYYTGMDAGRAEQRNTSNVEFNNRMQHITQAVLGQINTTGILFQKLSERYGINSSTDQCSECPTPLGLRR
jgi:hypothetical protein